MKEGKNPCLTCRVQGICCFHSIYIEGYNVILENQPCSYLNLNTMLCKDYKNRKKVKWCAGAVESIGKGGLPKECFYLQNQRKREPNPKVHLSEIINRISNDGITRYKFFNSMPNYEENYAIKVR